MLSAQTTQAINRCTGDMPRSRVFYFSYSEAPNKWAYSTGGAPPRPLLPRGNNQCIPREWVTEAQHAENPPMGFLRGHWKRLWHCWLRAQHVAKSWPMAWASWRQLIPQWTMCLKFGKVSEQNLGFFSKGDPQTKPDWSLFHPPCLLTPALSWSLRHLSENMFKGHQPRWPPMFPCQLQ